MAIPAGRHLLGPDDATLSVRTERGGAAARAGHDLLIRVASWEAALVVRDDPEEMSMELAADSRSLRVVEGTGGMQALGDDDIAKIHRTIDDEVLLRQDIRFRSTRVKPEPGGQRFRVEGSLELVLVIQPIAFDLVIGDSGEISASAVVRQSAWRVKPYSALFGALKVRDEVDVVLEGRLSPA